MKKEIIVTKEERLIVCSRASVRVLAARPTLSPLPGTPFLVFLHFFGGSARSWQPVTEILAGGYECIAVDLRSFGGTVVGESAGEVSSYSLDLMAADVIEVLQAMGGGSYVLVGHSMGAKVALAVAAGQGCPAGLRALALVAPSPPTPEPMPDAERARLLAGHGSEAAARETVSKTTAAPLPPALADAVVEDELRVALPAWRAWLERGSVADISARLTRVRVPVHLLAGKKDANITARLLKREIADRLPNGFAHDVETVPDAAHLLPLEAPAAVADFIRRAANDGR